MDLQIDDLRKLDNQVDINKLILVFASSSFLWIVPVGLKAPKLLTFIALPSAITGFAWCAKNSLKLKEKELENRKLSILFNELNNTKLGLLELKFKREIAEIYHPSATETVGSRVLVQSSEGAEKSAELLNPPVHNGSEGSYTAHELSAIDALEIIVEMIGEGQSKTSIIQELWQVAKGGSKAYKKACEEFDELMSRLEG
jgi:hypothetical protein